MHKHVTHLDFWCSVERYVLILKLHNNLELPCMSRNCDDIGGSTSISKRSFFIFNFPDEAVGALHKAGAILVIKSTPDSAEDMQVNEYKSNLMKRFRDLSYDVSS